MWSAGITGIGGGTGGAGRVDGVVQGVKVPLTSVKVEAGSYGQT